LCSISGRPRLTREIASLYTLIEGPMRLWVEQTTSRRRKAREAHQELLDALRTRDPVLAERVLQEHASSTVSRLIAFIEGSPSRT